MSKYQKALEELNKIIKNGGEYPDAEDTMCRKYKLKEYVLEQQLPMPQIL